ncbi:hypothetical protein [Silvimonas amylolytica]|uniref:hypothetical protein n=1 Tax=Silvimonas amylolytica TaxID=449663 RepID=UPI001669097A|nr:hypothetical protein [Silvimonas amylolytica]
MTTLFFFPTERQKGALLRAAPLFQKSTGTGRDHDWRAKTGNTVLRRHGRDPVVLIWLSV